MDFTHVMLYNRDSQELAAGGPKLRPTKTAWRAAAILNQIVKSLYLGNLLTGFY